MPQNSEQIEAKLCAFLEGELDEQGLADIEKHLQANPAHRKLLAEVGKTRGLLRALPRESAPPDICEAFQGQLERSVLLADLDDDGGQSATKASRWPQYFAAAAVVMLAAGLGTIVYFGLPSGGTGDRFVVAPPDTGGSPEQDGAATRSTASPSGLLRSSEETVTDLTAPPAPPAVPTAAPVISPTAPRADAIDAARLALRGPQTESATALTVNAQPPTSAPSAAAQDLSMLAKRVQGSWETRERKRLFASDAADETNRALASIPAGATYLVFTCAEPTAGADRIGRELEKLQVAWSVVPNPAPAAAQRTLDREGAIDPEEKLPVPNEVFDSDVADVEQLTTDAPGAREAPSPEAAVALRDGERSVARGAVAESRPAPTPDRSDDSDPVALSDTNAPMAYARGPATRPVGESPDSVDDLPGRAVIEEGVRPIGGGLAEPTAETDTLIVARGLTREQADSLRATLEAPGLEPRITLQSAGVQSSIGGTPATSGAASEVASRPTTADDGVVRQGAENLNVVIVLRGEDLDPGRGAPPQTMPAEPVGPIENFDILTIQIGDAEADSANVRVAEDGTVEVSGIGRLKAEGLTSPELENEIVAKLKQVTTPAQPGGRVKVRRIGNDTAATTSPAVSAPPPPLSPAPPSGEGGPDPNPVGDPK